MKEEEEEETEEKKKGEKEKRNYDFFLRRLVGFMVSPRSLYTSPLERTDEANPR